MKKEPEPFILPDGCDFRCVEYLKPYTKEMRGMFVQRYGKFPRTDLAESVHELPMLSPERTKAELCLRIREAEDKTTKLPLYLHLIKNKGGGQLILAEDFPSEGYTEILERFYLNGEDENHQLYFYNFRVRGHLEDIMRNYREFKDIYAAGENGLAAKMAIRV